MSTQPGLRIFSYLPNPRLAKATIAGRIGGVDIDIRGAKPTELAGWLWDFDPRPLEAGEDEPDSPTARVARKGFRGRIHKTDDFLDRHPFGNVPAAFSPDGATGIFESNSILRAVARLAPEASGLYGSGPYQASRIDSFLDVSLVMARESQTYLLALGRGELSDALHSEMSEALDTYLDGIERALAGDRLSLVGSTISIADIAYVAEVALLSQELASQEKLDSAGQARVFGPERRKSHPRALGHFVKLCKHEAFAPDLGRYLERWQRSAI